MAQNNVWTFRDTLRNEMDARRDLVGYDVTASDGSIGKIDRASVDTSRRYVVVDTGFWIFGKKRLIPAGVVTAVDHDRRAVQVSLTKDQVKNAPDYEDANTTYEDNYYEPFNTYYDRYGW